MKSSIEKEIQELSAALTRIEVGAEQAGRNLTSEERSLRAEMIGTISALTAELEKPQRPLTVPRNGPLGGGIYGSSSGEVSIAPSRPTGKTYKEMFVKQPMDTGGFKDFNEYLSVLSTGKFDPRLIQASMSETFPVEGGFAVPTEFASSLLDVSLETEIIRPRATVWPMKSESLKIPGFDAATHSASLFGGLTGSWIAEEGVSTEVFAKFRQIQLTARKLACYTSASNELVADGIDFEEQISRALIKTLGWYLDYAFLQGTGSTMPLGLLNDPALVSVTKEVGQKAATICFENCVKMYARLAPQCMANAIWIASQTTVPQLLTMSLAVGTGGAPIQPAVLQSNGQFSLLGKPMLFTEKLPVLGTVGDLILCDPSQYQIGLRKEISLDKSIHVGWTQDLSSYRAILRVDGAGSWDKAITPKAGSSLSWCVALATRA